MLLSTLFSNPISAIVIFLALVVAITVHEFAHAWTANRLGDPTAKMLGRVSLNPLKHLDLLGTLFLIIVGFGWGKPVPYNPSKLKSDADEIKVALAGIMANFLLALILGIPLRIATLTGVTIGSSLILQIIEIIVEINLLLIAFNIIPIPPLDGSKLVIYFMSPETRAKFERIGPFLLIMIILLGNFTSSSLLYQFMEPIIRVLSFVVKGSYINIY